MDSFYDPGMTLREARTMYFARNGFGDGGYEDRWVKVRLGRATLAFPNTRARRRVVQRHDLHHVLTGYPTSLAGEGEIAAWELASGCQGYLLAWLLNLNALLFGLLYKPRALLRAVARGLHSDNLFGQRLSEQLLDERVGVVRQRLGLNEAVPRLGAWEYFTFVGWCLCALLFNLLLLTLLLAPALALMSRLVK